jgi:flagellin
MPLGIGGTTSSLFAQNALRINNLLFAQTSAQLSSGKRLISGAIDPSGLAISQGLRSRIGGTDQAIYNAQDSVNLVRTADSQLGTQSDILNQMKGLAVRASNDATLNDSDKARLSSEFNSLAAELDRQGRSNSFNGKQLTTDQAGQQYGTQQAQVGPDNNASSQVGVTVAPSTGQSMGLTDAAGNPTYDFTVAGDAQAAMDQIDTAINQVSTARANLGVQDRGFQYTTNDLYSQKISLAAANSQIADTNMAETISEQTKSLLLTRVSIAALSQSNAQGFGVLKLLGAG